MFQLANDTPFAAERSVQLDPNGVQHWVVVVKGTYRFDGPAPALTDQQEPVCIASEYLGDAGSSSLLRETEMTYAHPGTDVIVNGAAYAPQGKSVRQMDVRVSIGQSAKALRVFGDRQWVSGGPDLLPSSPVPFQTMPICYERAYGGVLANGSAFEDRNPIGLGFGLTREELVNKPLPNIEDPAQPIRGPMDRPAPVGFGALAAHWMPRKQLAGTYDDRWKQTKLPLLPNDFSPRFFVAAPVGLHCPEPLQGGERIRLEGLSTEGPLEFPVPREVILITTTVKGDKIRRTPQLDRVIVEPDKRLVIAVWRMSLKVGTRFREVSESFINYKARWLR
jgi:hypothetical protein